MFVKTLLRLVYLIIFLVFSMVNVKAQNREVDSLLHLLSTHPSMDSIRVNLMNELAYKVYTIDINKTLKYAKDAQAISTTIKFKKGECESLRLIGVYYLQTGEIQKSISFYQQSLEKSEAIGYLKGIASCLGNMGQIYLDQGNYYKGLEYFQRTLSITEKIGDQHRVSMTYNNIGEIYNQQHNYPKAIEYYHKSLAISESIHSESLVLYGYLNLGDVYAKIDDKTKAFEYLQKTIKKGILTGEKQIVGTAYGILGNMYEKQKDYELASENYNKALNIYEEIDDKQYISLTLLDLASVHIKNGRHRDALPLVQRGLLLAKKMNILVEQYRAHDQLSQVYASTGNYKLAYEHHRIYKQLNDSVYNSNNQKKIITLEYEYKYEKDKQAAELEIQKKEAINKAEKKQQQIVLFSFIFGFVFMLLLAILAYRSYLLKHKTNIALTEQKQEIEEKNEELLQLNEEIVSQKTEISIQKEDIEKKNRNLTASIHYAQRIQNAFLPRPEVLSSYFPQSFILFKPRDIVSGDFYWIKQIRNFVFIAAADCTGHGVPGAFMSMLGTALLNEIVRNEQVKSAAEILDQLRDLVKSSLQQTGQRGETQDGMDISLCVFDLDNSTIQFAGANSPLYLVRDAQLVEYGADKMPIGIHPKDDRLFCNHEIQMKKNDIVYVFSDGYHSQVGGLRNEKFKTKRLKDTLLQIGNRSMDDQKKILEQTLQDWKGDKKQIDDILLLGIRCDW